MNPGCQSVLQHRVTPGDSTDCSNHVRYSLSFRTFKSSTCPSEAAPSQPAVSSPQHSQVKTATSLLVGDSFLARLDASRLGKGKKNIINIAKGGSKIPDVIKAVEYFCQNPANSGFHVDQVFVSVGTNDIRYCKSEGIMKLKGAMFKLIRALKTVFVGAKIFFQSLLPLPITYENYKYIARNILDFNNLIFHACSHERVYIINAFNDFLKGNVRNPYLFPVNLFY